MRGAKMGEVFTKSLDGVYLNNCICEVAMNIESYMSLKCGSEKELRQNISQALLEEGATANVNYYRLSDLEAEARGLKGSPTVLINGEPVQPIESEGFS